MSVFKFWSPSDVLFETSDSLMMAAAVLYRRLVALCVLSKYKIMNYVCVVQYKWSKHFSRLFWKNHCINVSLSLDSMKHCQSN